MTPGADRNTQAEVAGPADRGTGRAAERAIGRSADRAGLLWLAGSAVVGVAMIVVGAWLWSFEWTITVAASTVAMALGVLGSSSWLSSAGAERIERKMATTAFHRRLGDGSAEPSAGSVSLIPTTDGHVSMVTLPTPSSESDSSPG
ncbi:MAG: hypothetical protein AAF449_17280 [Myxococcota bacterium]